MIDPEMHNLTEAIDNKLDRSKWETWKFSDLVDNIVEKVVPKSSGLDYYIGLEHLDAGSLKIKRFGETSSLIGDKLKIYKGDLIFAKRNSYLKRVAIADFDAVASAHSMVLRPRSDNVNPDFLPFFMMSEVFWKRAIEISVGSLSPTINWKTLAKQVFLLPPKAEQARLAELLWAMDDVIEKEKEVLEKLTMLIFKKKEYIFIKGNGSKAQKPFLSFKIPEHWELKRITDVAEVEYGISESVANNTNPSLGWQIITGANINLDGSFELTKKRYIEAPSNKRFLLEQGDLMFNWRSGSPEHIGKTAFFNLEGNYTYASFILKIRCGKKLNKFYSFHLLNFLREVEFFTKNIAQQVNFKINATVFREIVIPIPPIEEQMEIEKVLNRLNSLKIDVDSKILASQALQKSLINQIF